MRYVYPSAHHIVNRHFRIEQNEMVLSVEGEALFRLTIRSIPAVLGIYSRVHHSFRAPNNLIGNWGACLQA